MTPSSYFKSDGTIVWGAVPAKDVLDFHTNSDVDSGALAQHHTLGKGAMQAAPGDHEHLIGQILMYGGPTVPDGYLACNGGLFNGLLYPQLARVLGTTHGANSGDFYKLPDLRGRSPIGVGMAVDAIGNNVGGNSYSVALRWGDERTESHAHPASSGNDSPDHSHGINAQLSSLDQAWAVTGGGSAGYFLAGSMQTGGRSAFHTHPITVSAQSSGAVAGMKNVHPVYCINFIMRAR